MSDNQNHVDKKAKRAKSPKRPAAEKRPRETTGNDPKEKRRFPRYPGNRIWSNATRERHRDDRDRAIEDAGLVTDRMIEKRQKPRSRSKSKPDD